VEHENKIKKNKTKNRRRTEKEKKELDWRRRSSGTGHVVWRVYLLLIIPIKKKI
jgi:hypothetical protein